MNLPQSYMSVSQIQKYLSCARSYYYRYCEGLDERKGSALLTGSAVHKVLEVYNKQKLETGELMSEEDLAAAFHGYWKDNVADIDWKEGEDPEAEKERGLSMASAYLEEYGKHLHPRGSEIGFLITIEGIPFKGFIDVIEVDGSIRDLKTSRKTPPKDQAEKSLQLAAYAEAYRFMTGEKERVTSLDYVVSLKGGPKVLRLETEITEGRLERLRDTTYQVAEAIDKEIFPRNEGPNCSYCAFREYCLT